MTNPFGNALKADFRGLHAALRSIERKLSKVMSTSGRVSTRRGRRRLSPKTRAALVLQGRYMGYMRQLKPKHKARVRRIRELKGVRVAISKARALAGRDLRPAHHR